MGKKTRIRESSPDDFASVALDTVAIGKQALVFVNSKKSAESSAEKIARKIPSKDLSLDELSKDALHLPRPTKQCEKLSMVLKKGVAFHHAGLTQRQRELIEDNFRSGRIKIICATPTLAAGVDLPAFRSIIKDVKRYNGRWGMDYIPVLEYLQQAGRAGRPGKEEFGEAIIFSGTKTEKDELHQKYILGTPEKIYSKLAVEPVLRTYVLSLVSAGFCRSRDELIDFFGRTFYARQFEDMARLESIIGKMIELLDGFGFVKRSGGKRGDFVPADEISDDRIEATPIGRRVAELYIDPLTANLLIESMGKAGGKKALPFPFLQMLSNTLEMRPLLRVKTRELADYEKLIGFYEEDLLSDIPSFYDDEYADFLNSIKTAKFLEDWIEEADEETLLEKYDIRPGEINAKLENADWISYSAEELAKLLNLNDVRKELTKLRVRLKHGAKEELLPLLRLRGIGRVRARKLFRGGIKDLGDVRKTDLSILSKILGKKIAETVKEEVSGETKKDKGIRESEERSRKEKQGKLGDY